MIDIQFDKIIRGAQVTIFANHFVEDKSVGLLFRPDEIWAETMDGVDFPLTSEEVDLFSEEAAELFRNRIIAKAQERYKTLVDKQWSEEWATSNWWIT